MSINKMLKRMLCSHRDKYYLGTFVGALGERNVLNCCRDCGMFLEVKGCHEK